MNVLHLEDILTSKQVCFTQLKTNLNQKIMKWSIKVFKFLKRRVYFSIRLFRYMYTNFSHILRSTFAILFRSTVHISKVTYKYGGDLSMRSGAKQRLVENQMRLIHFHYEIKLKLSLN